MPANVLKSQNRKLIKDALIDPNTFATTMIVILSDYYGQEMFTWAPQTIRMETEEDFDMKWPQANLDRLMAGIAILTTDNFYKSLPDFIELCNILSGSAATPGVFEPADAGECAWGITEALLIEPPDETDENPFDDQIRAFIGKTLELEGIIVPPDILKIATGREGLKLNIHNDYSDDPELYGAIWQAEESKTEDINSLVKERLTLLLNQLSVVQLMNGTTSEIAKKMLKGLNAHPKGGTPL